MKPTDELFNLDPKSAQAGPVECLGMTFSNDEERRKHFLGILREKLKHPEFRSIEGFPILHCLPKSVHRGLHQALRQALRPEQAI